MGEYRSGNRSKCRYVAAWAQLPGLEQRYHRHGPLHRRDMSRFRRSHNPCRAFAAAGRSGSCAAPS